MKKISFIIVAALCSCVLNAQEAMDLLRYNLYDVFGTARSMSMANAMGALGGDPAAIGINPAGLGIYRSSEISYSFYLNNVRTEASPVNAAPSYMNGVNNDHSLKTSNFALVSSMCTSKTKGLCNYNFALNYYRKKDFTATTAFQSEGLSRSILDNLVPGSLLQEMAYETYLLDLNKQPILHAGELVDNSLMLMESGYTDVWDFSMALNLSYFLYAGMSLGVQSLDYGMQTFYQESFKGGGRMELHNELNTTGTAYNLKVGAILRPVRWIRLGFAYHTPTYYSMVDRYIAYLSSYDVPNDQGMIPQGGVRVATNDASTEYIHYQLETPETYVYSAAVQLGKKGFISADWEVVNYRNIRERDGYGRPYADVNRDVDRSLNQVCNFRLGAEWRVMDQFSARCGYAYYPSPVNANFMTSNMHVSTASTSPHYYLFDGAELFSLGGGFHFDTFYLDLAWQSQTRKHSQLHPYYDETTSVYSGVRTTNNLLVTTVGFKF